MGIKNSTKIKIVAFLILILLLSSVFSTSSFSKQPQKGKKKIIFKNIKKIFFTGTKEFSSKETAGAMSFLKSHKDIENISIELSNESINISFMQSDKRNKDGWLLPYSNNTIYLNKKALKILLGNIENIAIMDHYFTTVNDTEGEMLKIEIKAQKHDKIMITSFKEPVLHKKLYTKGSKKSIFLETRAMFIELVKKEKKSLVISFDHPVDHSGQTVIINKAWLRQQGIEHPYFEWGEKKPWKPISYTENETCYFIKPKHFSTIGIHEAASGTTTGSLEQFPRPTRTYPYFKVCNLTGSYSGAYPIMIKVFYNNDSTTDVNCEGLCQPDFDDIRFRDYDDGNYLSYWKERYVEADYAIFWVKLTQDAISDGKIYVCYGNPNVNDTGSPTNIFTLFYDDFSEGLNLSIWKKVYQPDDIWVEDGALFVGYGAIIRTYQTFGTGTALRTRWRCTYASTNTEAEVGYGRWIDRVFAAEAIYGIYARNFDNFRLYTYTTNDGTIINIDRAKDTGYHIWDYRRYVSSAKAAALIDDMYETISTTDVPTSSMSIGAETEWDTLHGGNSRILIDWVGVRPWSETGPVYNSSFGNQTFTVMRSAGATSELDSVAFYPLFSCYYDWRFYLKIPVSTSVRAIINVTNTLTGENATRVNSLDELDDNTFYYDAGEKYVYIGISNMRTSNVIKWNIYCSYGASFEIAYPTFLRSGDYIHIRGLIKDADGNPISGTIAETYLYDEDGSVAVGPISWNCTNGNYQTSIATTGLTPAIYSIVVRFTDMVSGITFEDGATLTLDVPIEGGGGNGPYASAHLYYSFFDSNTGTGLNDDFFKFYISEDTVFTEADRVKGGVYPTHLSQTLYYKICDYFGNKIYPTDASYSSIFINYAETYLDVGVSLRQFLVKNMNDSTVYFIIRDPDTGQQVGRWIPPYDKETFFLLDNTYNLTIQYYYNNNQTLKKVEYVDNFSVNSDTFYVISGFSLGDIVIYIWNTNSTIMDQIVNVGVYVKNLNSSIINQIVNSTYLIDNINTSIQYQTNLIKMIVNNTESNITNQLNVMQQDINNQFSNIVNQTNYVWQAVNNTNTSILNQLNAVWQMVNNTNTSIVNQTNIIMQQIQNFESNITNQTNFIIQIVNNHNTTIVKQLNSVLQNINNTNATIHTQLNAVQQDIYNANATIHNQLNTIVQKINNTNATIHAQINSVSQQITNLNSTIDYQFNSFNLKIENVESNITNQINSVWLSVNNTNSSIHNQLNIVSADITNMNTSIHTQINAVSAQISSTESNITNQLNVINVKIANTESNITNQINAVNLTIVNHNTSVMTQLNSIINEILNSNTSIINQTNLILNRLSNTETNITNQVNAVQNMISNTESNITSQINIMMNEIDNVNSSIHTQLNIISANITNLNTNITTQHNYIEMMITNTESNLTNQINSVDVHITNVNDSIHTQLNNILAQIQNNNVSIVDQINLIWNSINNTNSSIHVQINGVHTTISNFWSNMNYSFTVIRNNITNTNTTIHNLINEVNATLYAKLVGVLDNVSEAGVSVFDKVVNVLDNLSNVNSSLHDQILNKALDIINNVTIETDENYEKILEIINAVGNITNGTIADTILDIVSNVTSLQRTITNSSNDILYALAGVNVNISDALDQILDAVQTVNISGYDQLIQLLNDILTQFQLPHEWRIPGVNYTIEDTVAPTTTISAEINLQSNIRVSWSSVDNILFGVAHVDLYYKVENASHWRQWLTNQPATGTSIFTLETLVPGKTYWFKAIATDINGNVENEGDNNICSITYERYNLNIQSPASSAVNFAISNWWIILILIGLIVLIGLAYVYLRKRGEGEIRV